MSEDQKLGLRICRELPHRYLPQATSFISRAIGSACAGAPVGQPARPVRMKGPKCANGCAIAHHRAHEAISAVFLFPQAVAVLYSRLPSGQISFPRADVVLDTNVLAKNIVAPAVMVAGDPQNWHAALAKIGERSESAEAVSRNDRLPFEPEVEQVAVDQKRAGPALKTSQKSHEGPFYVEGRYTKVSVGDHVARRGQHSRILAEWGIVHKQRSVLIFTAMTAAGSSPVTSEIEFLVRYAETDQMQVVYHANYLVWCEMGRTDLIRKLGTSYADVERQGVKLAVIDATLRYHGAARYEDKIRVRTVLGDVRSRRVTFHYTIENADTGAKLVTATTALASINGDGRLVAMPAHLRTALENAIA